MRWKTSLFQILLKRSHSKVSSLVRQTHSKLYVFEKIQCHFNSMWKLSSICINIKSLRNHQYYRLAVQTYIGFLVHWLVWSSTHDRRINDINDKNFDRHEHKKDQIFIIYEVQSKKVNFITTYDFDQYLMEQRIWLKCKRKFSVCLVARFCCLHTVVYSIIAVLVILINEKIASDNMLLFFSIF